MDTIDNIRLYDIESKIGTKILNIHTRWRPAELPTELTQVGTLHRSTSSAWSRVIESLSGYLTEQIETQCACRCVGADGLSKSVVQAALLLSSVLLTAVHDVNQTKSECL